MHLLVLREKKNKVAGHDGKNTQTILRLGGRGGRREGSVGERGFRWKKRIGEVFSLRLFKILYSS